MQIFQGLNPRQQEAVESINSPVLVLAGPGSGKTRVITHRIAYAVGTLGIERRRIAAVTFTNKAAREMKDRLNSLIPMGSEGMTVGTFHSLCASILRRDGAMMGLDNNFSIMDNDDQLAVVKRVMDDEDLDPKRYSVRAILAAISATKSKLIDVEEGMISGYRSYFEEIVTRVYTRYQALLERSNGVDFDDLLLKTHLLFKNEPRILERYQTRYTHLMVDEFQDTNVVQYSIVQQLAAHHRNICVVGDPDQSIYSWRSADIRNILSFQKDYPDATIVTLEENYRSTQTILEGALSIISSNKQRVEKTLWTNNPKGQTIVIVESYNEDEEAEQVVSELRRLTREEHYRLVDCAVMYRTNAQSRNFEDACIRIGLPYKLVGGVRFYHRREVKDAIAYLRLINNPLDDSSFLRIANVPPRGIGQRTLEQLIEYAGSRDISLYQAISEIQGLNPRAERACLGFSNLLARLKEASERLDLINLIDVTLEQVGYRRFLLDSSLEGEERWENVMELRSVAEEFHILGPGEALIPFLERVTLVSDVDSLDDGDDALTLITLHQAKGLEYAVVFITGLEEGKLPHARSLDDPDQLEEERRLCYVGMTRAKQRLYMTRAFRRGFMGRSYGSSNTMPSRFLLDIPQHLVTRMRKPHYTWNLPFAGLSTRNIGESGPQVSIVPFKSGERVHHERFGDGVVVNSMATGVDFEVTVAFKGNAGIKRLLASIANLERL